MQAWRAPARAMGDIIACQGTQGRTPPRRSPDCGPHPHMRERPRIRTGGAGGGRDPARPTARGLSSPHLPKHPLARLPTGDPHASLSGTCEGSGGALPAPSPAKQCGRRAAPGPGPRRHVDDRPTAQSATRPAAASRARHDVCSIIGVGARAPPYPHPPSAHQRRHHEPAAAPGRQSDGPRETDERTPQHHESSATQGAVAGL